MAATTRKLTTVFAADVQGYSRLMEHDEEGTLATLKQYREAMGRLVTTHNGRVVNTWGDAVIAEFGSVVEAVRAAVDVQNELAHRNAGRSREARMLFRIGINLGDVIVDEDDIYGDGVNIAARLQSEAEPGGILISHTVYEQVRNKVAVSFDFLGDLQVKNIEERVPSYSVRIGEDTAGPDDTKPERSRRSIPTSPQPPSWGRDAPPVPHEENSASLFSRLPIPKELAGLAIAAIVVVAINLFTWGGSFWAKWPLLGIAVAAAIRWLRYHGRGREN